MSEAKEVTVVIDGKEVNVAQGTLLLDAASKAGIHIPIYCAHSKMEPVAVCRMCLVQVEKMPKLQPACATVVSEGMVAHTQNEQVAKTREGVLEFLLLNHPLDCPVCDRGGECDLQDFAFRYGPETSRFPITEKLHADKARVLSSRIEFDQERCILCWRCTRYYDEITGEKELVLQKRGVNTVIETFNGQELTSEYQGNLPEICPVGALTHREYRFKARPWDLQRTKSVCSECSYGCNINIDTREFEIKRFASRDNPLVDDMWLCDQGRYSSNKWNDVKRVRRAMVAPRKGPPKEVSVDAALKQAAQELQTVVKDNPSAIAVFGSPESTNEELWLLQKLTREILKTPNIDHQFDAFINLSAEEHSLGIAELEECAAILVLGPEPEINAPVLKLRLYKAEHKRGVRILRVAKDIDLNELDTNLKGLPLVGIVVDESNRQHGEKITLHLAQHNQTIKRLTITRAVNGRGAKDMGILPNLLPGYVSAPTVGKNGGQILSAIRSGEIKALLTLDAERMMSSLDKSDQDLLKTLDVLVGIENSLGIVSSTATVLLPAHTYMEKTGSVTNTEGRVQRIRPALPPATACPPVTKLLTMLGRALGAEHDWSSSDPIAINQAICKSLPAYAQAGNGGRASWKGSEART